MWSMLPRVMKQFSVFEQIFLPVTDRAAGSVTVVQSSVASRPTTGQCGMCLEASSCVRRHKRKCYARSPRPQRTFPASPGATGD
jgi:hypothetical protein